MGFCAYAHWIRRMGRFQWWRLATNKCAEAQLVEKIELEADGKAPKALQAEKIGLEMREKGAVREVTAPFSDYKYGKRYPWLMH
ncbi:hypothetical protein PAT3040_05710 [Paenibacillus agaridevorans]|uniref:Uncharacterized protein n=2 Tax=Paenibacillus agaridevorans TaxID=171404 RepID=A0A2R5F0Q1_9BACL|nr:hypothetical protein PAT3040_05710 [Paenibacillus agaridevorans]